MELKDSLELLMTPDEILQQLRTKLAVSKPVARQALGVSYYVFEEAIRRGAVPVADLGEGAKAQPIASWWILKQLGLEKEGKADA
jgi:hypothetical protein